jgi:hypothetical protein
MRASWVPATTLRSSLIGRADQSAIDRPSILLPRAASFSRVPPQSGQERRVTTRASPSRSASVR